MSIQSPDAPSAFVDWPRYVLKHTRILRLTFRLSKNFQFIYLGTNRSVDLHNTAPLSPHRPYILPSQHFAVAQQYHHLLCHGPRTYDPRLPQRRPLPQSLLRHHPCFVHSLPFLSPSNQPLNPPQYMPYVPCARRAKPVSHEVPLITPPSQRGVTTQHMVPQSASAMMTHFEHRLAPRQNYHSEHQQQKTEHSAVGQGPGLGCITPWAVWEH